MNMLTNKGPWRVSYSEEDALVFNGQRPCAVIAADGTTIACNTSYYPTELDPDNANLIAAAPELLEALQAIDDMWSKCDGERVGPDEARSPEVRKVWHEMRAAIAKSLGKAIV